MRNEAQNAIEQEEYKFMRLPNKKTQPQKHPEEFERNTDDTNHILHGQSC